MDSPICPLCQAHRGTNVCLYWRCHSEECEAARSSLTDPSAKENVRHVAKLTADSERSDWLWSRGIIPDPAVGVRFPTTPDTCRWEGEADGLFGMAATAGSLQRGQLPRFRAEGWAVATATSAVSGRSPPPHHPRGGDVDAHILEAQSYGGCGACRQLQHRADATSRQSLRMLYEPSLGES